MLDTTGSVARFQLVFSNTGSEEAYNVRVVDNYLGSTNITAGSVSFISVTSGLSVVNSTTTNGIDLTIAKLDPGQSVTIVYSVTVTDLSLAVPAVQAQVVYESLSASGATLTASQGGVDRGDDQGDGLVAADRLSLFEPLRGGGAQHQAGAREIPLERIA